MGSKTRFIAEFYHISSVIRHSFCLPKTILKSRSKNLDPSYKMNLDSCDYLGRVKLVL